MLKALVIGLLTMIAIPQAGIEQSSINTDLSGIWNAWNTTPPKGVADMPHPLQSDVPTTFLVYSDGKTFQGKFIMDAYPGSGDVIDGRIDGNKVSFTMVAHPVLNNQPVDEVVYCAGTISGDDMNLTVRWPLSSDQTRHSEIQLIMKAKKFHHE
jgi:hypothetical protein